MAKKIRNGEKIVKWRKISELENDWRKWRNGERLEKSKIVESSKEWFPLYYSIENYLPTTS